LNVLDIKRAGENYLNNLEEGKMGGEGTKSIPVLMGDL